MQDLVQQRIAYGNAPQPIAAQSVSNQSLDTVKDHVTANPVSRVAGGMSEDMRGLLFGILYGAVCSGLLYFANKFALNDGKSENLVNKIDGNKTVQGISASVSKGWKVVTTPFNGIVNYFNRTWIAPRLDMTRTMSRPAVGHLVDSFLNQSVSHAEKVKDLTLKENLKALQATWIKQRSVADAKSTFEKTLKLLGGTVPEHLKGAEAGIRLAAGESKTIFAKGLRALYANTNSFFGLQALRKGNIFGIIQSVFMAMFVGDAIYQTQKAPKGDKTSTFMESLFGNVLPWVFQNKIISSIGLLGGLRSAKGWVYGPILRGIGKFLGVGLDPTVKTGPIKRWGGFAMRLGLGLALFSVIGNVGRKVSHRIFGKPQKTIEEEKKEQAEKEAAKAKEAMNIGNPISPLQVPDLPPDLPPSSLVKKYVQQARAFNSSIPQRHLSTDPSLYIPEPLSNNSPETLAKLDRVLGKIDKITGSVKDG